MATRVKQWSLIATAGVVMFAMGHWTGGLGQSSLAALQDTGAGAAPMGGAMQDNSMMAWEKAGTPGEHHELLANLAGEFDIVAKLWMIPDSAPFESRGTMSREMILDGHYLKETIRATDPGGEMTFEGMAILAYDNVKQQFKSIWIDNSITSIMHDTGTYNPETKKFTMRSSYQDPATGATIHTRGELDISNPRRQVMRGWETGPNGRERQTFEGIAERK